MSDMKNPDPVAQNAVENFIRVADKRDNVDAWPSVDLFCRLWIRGNMIQDFTKPAFDRD